MQSDPSHVQFGIVTVNGVDFEKWGVTDDAGQLITWLVNRDAASGDVIPGTLRNETPPATNTPAPATPSKLSPTKGDASHVYTGTDAGGDNWQTTDSAGRVIGWAVKPGDDSRNVLPGTLHTLSLPTGNPVLTGNNSSGLGAASNAPATATTSNPPANYVTPPAATNSGDVAYTHPVSGARGSIPFAWKRAGTAANGDPIFAVTDSAGTVQTFGLNGNFAAYFGAVAVSSPPPANPAVSTGTAGSGGGGVSGTVAPANTGTVAFVHPVSNAPGNIPSTWNRVGTAANGDPIFSLKDAAGTVQTFGLNSQFQAYFGAAPATGNLPTAATALDSKTALFVGIAVVALKAFVLS